MSNLVIRAGHEAFHNIKKNGLPLTSIKGVVAAAGGPKWFTTYGLTRYIVADLLAKASHELHFLGASVGSWQMASALTSDPGSAIDRLQHKYCNWVYSEKPDSKEVSEACKQMILNMLHDEANFILRHPSRKLHVFTSRGKGWLGSENVLLRGLGFAYAFSSNAVHRKYINTTAERVVFTTGDNLPYEINRDILKTSVSNLTEQNLLSVLRASGSIPFVMEHIADIHGAKPGIYWDGGMTDYHFSLPFNVDGIILQPHFLPYVLPGWLDKKIPWNRKAPPDLMSKVLLISPSEQFVNSLPLKRISDMKDFNHFGHNQEGRINYWREISQRSKELGEELKDLIERDRISDVILPYSK